MKSMFTIGFGAILGMLAVQFAPIEVEVQMRTKEKGYIQLYVDTVWVLMKRKLNGSSFPNLQIIPLI
jgi:hypothetical protein